MYTIGCSDDKFSSLTKGRQSNTKQKLELPIYDHSQCQEKFATAANTFIDDSQLCAGGLYIQDACDGDSGGQSLEYSCGTCGNDGNDCEFRSTDEIHGQLLGRRRNRIVRSSLWIGRVARCLYTSFEF